MDPLEIERLLTSAQIKKAALSNEVTLLSEMPVNALGKIHKPGLKTREIERAVRVEAEALGIDSIYVDAVQDAKVGILAQVSEHSELRVRLGRCTFPVDWIAVKEEPE